MCAAGFEAGIFSDNQALSDGRSGETGIPGGYLYSLCPGEMWERQKELALSDNFGEMLDHVLHVVKYISEMEVGDLIEDLKKISEYKMEINDYLDLLTIWYRDVLLFKATRDADSMIFSDELISIRKKARESSYEGLGQIIEALEKAKQRLKANVNFDLTMELLLLTMKEN